MKRMVVLGLVLLQACGGEGTVTFTTYGEDFIEDRIPASDGTSAGFVDGWELRFSKFLVALGEIQIYSHESTAALQETPKLFDVHKPGPVLVQTFEKIPAQAWDHVAFAIAPYTQLTSGNATSEDVAMMASQGWSLYVEATASLDAQSKTLAWGFPLNTRYEHCESDEYGEGVTVPIGGEETVQLTIHGDHLFYDQLQSSSAKMRFDAIANADKNANGVVTLEELATVDLTTLPANLYGTAGAGSVRTLKDFVSALARTLGHYRGEGECTPKAR